MTMASAANPKYFTPYELNNDYYISGDNVAESPAMHAFLYATQTLDKDPS
jgi:patatin-like phospholipase/acyl hydrolase